MINHKSNRIIFLFFIGILVLFSLSFIRTSTKAKTITSPTYSSNIVIKHNNRKIKYNHSIQNNKFHKQITKNTNNQKVSPNNNRFSKYWNRWNRKNYVDLRPKMTYTSQNSVPDACEAASLKMALSIKGKAKKVSLRKMVNRIGWRRHGNPNYEYSNNPYFRDGATIFPREIVRVAKRYRTRARIANYSSKRKLINILLKHDPIVIEAGHKMHITSDHIVCLIGYRHALHSTLSEFEYADPESLKPLIRWTNTNWFMKVYRRPRITGERAVIIL